VGPRAGLDEDKRTFLTHQGFELRPSSIQPVASRYSDCAYQAPLSFFLSFLPLTNQSFPWPPVPFVSLNTSRFCLPCIVHHVSPLVLLLCPNNEDRKFLRNVVTFIPNHSFNFQCMLIQAERPYTPKGEDSFSRPNFIKPEVVLLLQVRDWRLVEHEADVPHTASELRAYA
jgi:hypothetical protein